MPNVVIRICLIGALLNFLRHSESFKLGRARRTKGMEGKEKLIGARSSVVGFGGQWGEKVVRETQFCG